MKIIPEPKDLREWGIMYRRMLKELENMEYSNDLEEAVGQAEVIDLFRVTRAMVGIEKARERIIEIKKTADVLKNVAKRWYEQKKSNARTEACLKYVELYPSADDRKAYAESKATKYRDKFDAITVIKEAIEDEKRRFFHWEEMITQIGHNVRRETPEAR